MRSVSLEDPCDDSANAALLAIVAPAVTLLSYLLDFRPKLKAPELLTDPTICFKIEPYVGCRDQYFSRRSGYNLPDGEHKLFYFLSAQLSQVILESLDEEIEFMPELSKDEHISSSMIVFDYLSILNQLEKRHIELDSLYVGLC